MEKQKIDLYLAQNAKYFEPTAIPMIRKKLEQADDDAYLTLQAIELLDPTMMIIFSVFLGGWGVDRFMLGDIGMGVLKLLTGGLCGILWLIDIFSITKKTKQKNLAKLSMLL